MQMVTAPVKLVNIIDKTERRFKQLLGFCNMNLLFPLIIFFCVCHDSRLNSPKKCCAVPQQQLDNFVCSSCS